MFHSSIAHDGNVDLGIAAAHIRAHRTRVIVASAQILFSDIEKCGILESRKTIINTFNFLKFK